MTLEFYLYLNILAFVIFFIKFQAAIFFFECSFFSAPFTFQDEKISKVATFNAVVNLKPYTELETAVLYTIFIVSHRNFLCNKEINMYNLKMNVQF